MTQLLQTAFKEIINIVFSNNYVICNQFNFLKRIKYTATHTQTEFNATERKQNTLDTFIPINTTESLSVTIINDVITTSATLLACAKALKTLGAKKVIRVSCCTPSYGF